jgi:hypothetical protein
MDGVKSQMIYQNCDRYQFIIYHQLKFVAELPSNNNFYSTAHKDSLSRADFDDLFKSEMKKFIFDENYGHYRDIYL